MSLRVRIALILAAVALGVSAFAAMASYLSTRSELHAGIDETLKGRIVAVNEQRGPGPGGRGGRGGPLNLGGCPSPGSFQPASGAQLVSTAGAVTACITGGPTLPVVAVAGRRVDLRTVTVDGDRYRLITGPWRGGGTIQIARSLAEADDVLRGMQLRLLGLAALATAVAAALGWAIADRMTRPIVRLRDVTHHIATTSDLSTAIDASGPGEVGDLATSFGTMVAALGRSQDQQRRLVSDASHEMRTPLTSLRSNVELLRRVEELPAQDRHEVIADVLEDVDELSTLLGELVDLASDLASTEEPEPVQLGDLARAVATRTQRRANREVTVTDVNVRDVLARPRQLERAIGNLVDNAVKYSAGPVEIAIDGGTVAVRDRGPGIPEADLDRVFDRFYRAVEARTEPGSGLGLAIVAEVIRSHGGSTFARNRDGGGAEVGFTLP